MSLHTNNNHRNQPDKGVPLTDNTLDVSIILVNLNGRDLLGSCLESLELLNYPAELFEVILVDNGSSDDSLAFVKAEHPQTILIENSENMGFAAACNDGAKAARGEYVAFINNDMRADPEWLNELVSAIETAPDVAAVGGKIMNWRGDSPDFVGGGMNFLGMGFQPLDKPLPDDRLSEMLFACGGSMLVKKSIFLEVGGFDPDFFAYFEDVDFGWRLWILGYRVLYAPGSVTFHRHHGTAGGFRWSARTVLYERNSLYSVFKNYNDENFAKAFPAALLMNAKRALVRSSVIKNSYRIPGVSHVVDGIDGESRSFPDNTVSGKLSFALRLCISLVKSSGIRGLAQFYRGVISLLMQKLAPLMPYDHTIVPRHFVSHTIAVDDLLDNLLSLMARRSWIQSRRQRTDEEIFRLFLVPFEYNHEAPEYRAAQNQIVRALGIDSWFQEYDQ